MAWVFERAIDQACPRGTTALLLRIIRELWALPGAIVSEHWHARIKQTMIEPTHSVDGKLALRSDGGSWREVLAAVAPFLLLGAVPSLLGPIPLSRRLSTVLGIVDLSALGGSVLSSYRGEGISPLA